ncbi:hypothetical protein [Roseospira navarrensis]|uniref:Uncharacterized protein n=1 Tax=Roseospira navarrensis TaxID=140058 RepID=A0A7X1ZGV4_9PROT|nr:hypothetical protein [Roseospira navarrensis]MQX38225.1 hypothetical protein [Roseospira navarrensis]
MWALALIIVLSGLAAGQIILYFLKLTISSKTISIIVILVGALSLAAILIYGRSWDDGSDAMLADGWTADMPAQLEGTWAVEGGCDKEGATIMVLSDGRYRWSETKSRGELQALYISKSLDGLQINYPGHASSLDILYHIAIALRDPLNGYDAKELIRVVVVKHGAGMRLTRTIIDTDRAQRFFGVNRGSSFIIKNFEYCGAGSGAMS